MYLTSGADHELASSLSINMRVVLKVNIIHHSHANYPVIELCRFIYCWWCVENFSMEVFFFALFPKTAIISILLSYVLFQESQLHIAAQNGDLNWVQSLVDGKTDIGITDENGVSV